MRTAGIVGIGPGVSKQLSEVLTMLKERNNTFAGRKVEIIFAGTAAQPMHVLGEYAAKNLE